MTVEPPLDAPPCFCRPTLTDSLALDFELPDPLRDDEDHDVGDTPYLRAVQHAAFLANRAFTRRRAPLDASTVLRARLAHSFLDRQGAATRQGRRRDTIALRNSA